MNSDTQCSSRGDFSWGVRIGLVFVVESAFLSNISVTALLAYVMYNAWHNAYRPPPVGAPRWFFLRTHLDYYFLSLLICDLILSLGSIINIRWISIGTLASGTLCTSQAILKHAGGVGVSLTSLAISVHTFAVLILRWKAPTSNILPLIVIGIICFFLVAITLIPSLAYRDHKRPFYGPASYWCWIDKDYTKERIGLEYGILWFTALVNIVLYTPLFLCLRGNLVVNHSYASNANEQPHLKISWRSVNRDAWADRGDDQRRQSTVVARQMLAYPIAYTFLILPLSIARWAEPKNRCQHLPSEWPAFASVIFSSSGFVNVCLYVITRPALLPSWHRRRATEPTNDNIDSITQVNPSGKTTTAPLAMQTMIPGVSYPSNSRASANQVATSMPMLSDDDDEDGEITQAPAGPSRTQNLSIPGHPRRTSSTSYQRSVSSIAPSNGGSRYEETHPWLA